MKINSVKAICAIAILTATSSSVLAQGQNPSGVVQKLDVRVKGQIIPPACRAHLSQRGTVDYGTIKAESLQNNYTVLGKHTLDFSITCKAPTKMKLTTVNYSPIVWLGTKK